MATRQQLIEAHATECLRFVSENVKLIKKTSEGIEDRKWYTKGDPKVQIHIMKLQNEMFVAVYDCVASIGNLILLQKDNPIPLAVVVGNKVKFAEVCCDLAAAYIVFDESEGFIFNEAEIN